MIQCNIDPTLVCTEVYDDSAAFSCQHACRLKVPYSYFQRHRFEYSVAGHSQLRFEIRQVGPATALLGIGDASVIPPFCFPATHSVRRLNGSGVLEPTAFELSLSSNFYMLDLSVAQSLDRLDF